ncbi:MAG: sporulation protein YqfD [Roseburia sp.]|nr:sporulation protein YqfD [Roseburia sp.]MCM1097413.1 sporulation protein YqfD [Ruminococcus flavefaciens]
MIEFLRYIRGYLRIRVSGFSPERFMNLCSNKGILLSNIVRQGDAYEMDIRLKDFWALRPIVRKTGTRAAVLGRYGLPFFLPRLLRRKMFVGGLVFAVAFWFWSSFFVWDIELSGNYRITEDVFETFLKERQVTVGMKKEALDIEELEKEIRRQFPEITWASARLEGTRLKIDVKENDAPILQEEEKEEAGHDLVAEYGGTIVSILVRSGVPGVTAGDVVEEGTILVEGKVPVYNEDATVREYRYVDADADILLEHTITFAEQLPLDHVEKEYTGREKRRYYLRFGNREWRMPQERPFLVYDSVIRESRPLLFEKLSVPLYAGTYTYREYQDVEYEYTPEEAKGILKEKLMSFLTSLEEKGVQIVAKDVKINVNGGFWVLSGELTVREPVGRSVATEKTIIGETENDG